MIDAHPLVRLGVREALASDFEIHESDTRDEAIGLIRDVGSIDVAIVDLRRGLSEGEAVMHGHDAIRTLRKTAPGLGIVAHGERPDRHLASIALQAGASAYVSRIASADLMAKAAWAALEQERFVDPAVPPRGSRGKLTRRQREILQLLADGGSTVVAARELGLSEETIKTHTKNALARLGARNRTHAVAIALRESLID
ncbi:MAG TPA: response regulator transcription factor [Solirubrobacterales bacterium]|nr:response regulator transcription factor [Solirubrobacterales bacterium]